MNRYIKLKKIFDPKTKKQYYKRAKYPNIYASSSDIYIVTNVGDRLDTLAYQFYKDSQLWWIISIANPNVIRKDSYYLKPGLQIRIPTDVEQIYKDYENLNK